jgi:hypothetical protein
MLALNIFSFFKKKFALVPDAKIRQGIQKSEEAILDAGGKEGDEAYEIEGAGLKHTFSDAIYVRECILPKGMLLTSKIHKTSHPYFILKGKAKVLTEEGIKVVTAPCYGVTPAGTKRLIYVLEDVVWCTCHATKSKDLQKIEKQTIAKDFGEFDFSEADKRKLLEE